MSSQTPMPATGATARADPVRQGLADPEVARRLMLLVRAALGRFPAGVTAAQRECEAEEMFQEVAKCAVQSAHRFDPTRSLLHWLGGIVWNVARQRRPARWTTTEPILLEEMALDRHDPVPEEVALRLDCRAILEQLPADEAQLLRLHVEGRTAQEIGEQLQLKAGTVRVRLSRLIKRLRDTFPDTNGEAGHD